jgi:hypothetical protein
MKIKTSEITRENTLLSHMILTCLDSATIKKHIKSKEDRTGDTEYDVKLSFEGEELDIKKFFKLLDEEWDGEVKKAAKPYAEELFEERKHSFMSKNSQNAKLEAIKKQIEKANNQLKNIESAFSCLW